MVQMKANLQVMSKVYKKRPGILEGRCDTSAHVYPRFLRSTSLSGVATLDESCPADRLVEVYESTSSYDTSMTRKTVRVSGSMFITIHSISSYGQ